MGNGGKKLCNSPEDTWREVEEGKIAQRLRASNRLDEKMVKIQLGLGMFLLLGTSGVLPASLVQSMFVPSRPFCSARQFLVHSSRMRHGASAARCRWKAETMPENLLGPNSLEQVKGACGWRQGDRYACQGLPAHEQ